jgi:uncharacterized protein
VESSRLGVVRAVRAAETHISILIFIGEKVYKIRKPVRFAFLDFRDRADRAVDCHREVELNRRLAPDVYLGVADIVMDDEPVDHMVVMRALPEERQLTSLLQSDADIGKSLDQVALTLSSFHATATRSAQIAASASPSALTHKWVENFEEVARFVGNPLDSSVETEIHALVARWISTHRALLEARIVDGHICDGHGDLQASDIFCLDDGVRILDCLEFSDTLRYDDVCADVAFLAMDMERLGRPDAALSFTRAYERHSGSRLPPSLLHFHVALRAYVRAKVACLRSEQSDDAADSAGDLHAMALRHLRSARSALVLVGGLPGTGKSTLAAGLAKETGWVLLRSDELRRQRPVSSDRYAPDAVTAVYEEILRTGRKHLEQGESVILDASWVSAAQRARAAEVARETQSELIAICCQCEDTVGADRIRQRLKRGDDVSEATVGVRDVLEAQLDPWPSALVVDTSHTGAAANLEAALRWLATA